MYELLKAQSRDTKWAPKSLRKQGHIPGVIFGKDFDSVDIQVSSKIFSKFIGKSVKVFELEVEGKGKHLVSLDTIQKDHLGNSFMHIAFHKLSRNEKATVTLPLHLTGTAIGSKSGGIVNQVLNSIEVKGLPGDMPESIEFDISALELGGNLTLADLSLPRGLEFTHDSHESIVSCQAPKIEAAPEETSEEASPEASTEEGTAEVKEAA